MKHHTWLLTVLLLAGCSSVPEILPVKDPAQVWQSRQQALSSVQHWRISGRLVVTNGVEAWHLKVDWRQDADVYVIHLSGPFGAGHVRLQGSHSGVVLQNADNESFYAQDAEELLYAQTGVRMPMGGLRYWIVGLPDPTGNGVPQLDAFGRLQRLEQQQWNIVFKRYKSVNGLELPEKIFIDKQDVDIRLVIDEWELGVEVSEDPSLG